MRVVHSPIHGLHVPRTEVWTGRLVPHVETPERAERILAALEEDGSFELREPTPHGVEPIEAVHDPGLIAFLEEAWEAWEAAGEEGEAVPDTVLHPGLRAGMGEGREPSSIVARLGYWTFETMTPVGAGTYRAARAAADVALTAADLVLGGEPAAYALCRPPGHHAARSLFGGYCYLNNAAVAAEHVVRRTGEPVAVLDLDYHHGNGTQQIFYERPDVLYVSVHGDPARAYPYFTGFDEETGAGAGAGTTVNLPLAPGCGDPAYLEALDRALERVRSFGGSVAVVSLGVDTYREDPICDFALSAEVYEEMGRRVAAAGRRLVVVQEGGYHLPTLGTNVRRWLLGAAAGLG